MKTSEEKIVKLNGKKYTKKFGFICEKLTETNYIEVINKALLEILSKEL